MATPKKKKPRPNPAATMPGKNGGTLRRGGTNPGSGRPATASFAQFVRELHKEDDVRAAIRSAAMDSEKRGFSPVLKLMAEYDPERPAPPKQELTGELVVRVVRD